MSVARAQQEISSREFLEWMEYCKLQPFGELREDIRAARTCQTIATYSQVRKPSYRPKLVDFLLQFKQPETEAVTGWWEKFKAGAKAHNERLKRGECRHPDGNHPGPDE